MTPDETSDLAELIPLEPLVRNRQVLGMGEATHGTREFFNMKTKMFKFLSSRCGYRIFTIEANYGGTLKVNDYVLYGKGDVLGAMQGMEFWTWDTEEVKELIEWMRTTNAGKADQEKLKFYGFDCQSFKGPANALLDYVKEFDKLNQDEFIKGLSVLHDSSDLYFYTLKPGKSSRQGIAEIHGIISFLENWFHEKENLYIAGSGKAKFDLARYNIETLKQVIRLTESPARRYGFIRDSCMAQNIKWICRQEKLKVFVWAHNGHVSKAPSFDRHAACMGMFLDTIFGPGYYNIGFVFNKGGFQAISYPGKKLEEFTIPRCPRNSLTNGLVSSGHNAFFIDMTASANKLFRTPERTYYIGAVFMQKYWNKYSKAIVAKKQFDGLIFINSVSRAVPLSRKK
ncbi:MAG: erythromycin esterase family protein [Bacteroidota bacterium]